MIVDSAVYRDGSRIPIDCAKDDYSRLRDALETGDFVWVGLHEPTFAEMNAVSGAFGLHELAVEDAQHFHLRPKIDQYDDRVYFVILRTARYVDEREEVEFGEISVFLGPSFVITVRQGVASDLHDARLRLEQRSELLNAGTASVLWAILDKVVDDYAPVVEGLEGDIEEVEATVFSGAAAPTQRIYFLRREITDFYRAVHPLLAPLDDVERGAFNIRPELIPYFRDVHDHVRLVNDEVSAQRDLLTTVLEANMAVISVEQTRISLRQTESMRQLTLVATIFLPLSFVVGFFGQNFGWLVSHVEPLGAFLGYGIGGLVVSGAILYAWLRSASD